MNMWLERENFLEREFVFKDFIEALAFVVKVGILAERLGHHPDIIIKYNRVLIRTTTHDEGNKITDKDRKLAELIDGMA
ncbi:MAG: 4a-hydroxytetrahydrobiopterin dehydratase [candidate division WOR-3 bacterium]